MTLRCKANTETVIRWLNEALATDIICVLRYKRHYFMTARISSRHVKAKFLNMVNEERAHADQLRSKPDLSPERLLSRSEAEHVEGDSLTEMITADLLAKQLPIDSYRAMITSIGADDPTSRQALEQILAQEEAHAENLAGFLRG